MLLHAIQILLVLLGFASLSAFITSSILRAIKYFEENPYGSKAMIQSILRTTSLLHVILIFFKIPFKLILISILSQIIYLSMLDDYPKIKFNDKRMIMALILTVFTHFYFVVLNSKMSSNILKTVFIYYVIWLNPVMLCISIGAIDRNMPFKA